MNWKKIVKTALDPTGISRGIIKSVKSGDWKYSIPFGIGAGMNAAENRNVQQDQFQQNLEFQQEQQQYDRSLQERIFEREDTAMQRRAADLQAAGLSKTLLSGGAPSGALVGGSAPQRDPAQRESTGLSLGDIMSIMITDANLNKLDADVKNIQKQNENIGAQTALTNAQKNATNVKSQIDKHDLEIYKDSGMPSNASEFGKWFREGISGVKNAYQKFQNYINEDEAERYKRYNQSQRKARYGHFDFDVNYYNKLKRAYGGR